MDLWYTERHTAGVGLTLKVTATLYSGRSPYQRLDVLDTVEFGRVMLRDGRLMVAERDAFIHHEMLTHPALFTHPAPKRVLVVGGGDGGAIREIIKHPGVEEAVLCELDGLVIEKSIQFLPELASAIDGSNPRVRLHIEDGLAYLADQHQGFDLIILDTTDLTGPANSRFGPELYQRACAALKTDGMLVAPARSPFYDAAGQRELCRQLRSLFPIVELYLASVPSCPGGQWGYVCASNTYHPVEDFDPNRVRQRQFASRCYTEELHLGAFMLPGFVRENIG